jgi:uridine phosphorylase
MDITSPIPKNARGRFYHLDCAPGEIAPYILTCGDPDRAQRLARFFGVRLKNMIFKPYRF